MSSGSLNVAWSGLRETQEGGPVSAPRTLGTVPGKSLQAEEWPERKPAGVELVLELPFLLHQNSRF